MAKERRKGECGPGIGGCWEGVTVNRLGWTVGDFAVSGLSIASA